MRYTVEPAHETLVTMHGGGDLDGCQYTLISLAIHRDGKFFANTECSLYRLHPENTYTQSKAFRAYKKAWAIQDRSIVIDPDEVFSEAHVFGQARVLRDALNAYDGHIANAA